MTHHNPSVDHVLPYNLTTVELYGNCIVIYFADASRSVRREGITVSPIRILDADLINSVARIAPEKVEALETFRINHDPCIVFTNDQKFNFMVNTKSKEIKLPIVALEYLWCACYAFYVIYQEYIAVNQCPANEFDLNGNRRLRKALALYKWGVEQLNQTLQEWPSDNAKPEVGSNIDEDIGVANELYLCAAAWIIHHEFAHIYHGHKNEPSNNDESRTQEKEADNSATKWVLEGVSDEAMLKKRGLGVAIATLLLTAKDILAGEFKETTHPKSFQRLYDAISPYFQDENHLVYAFSTVICHINMAIGGIAPKKNDNETWKENLETCLVQFSRLKRS